MHEAVCAACIAGLEWLKTPVPTKAMYVLGTPHTNSPRHTASFSLTCTGRKKGKLPPPLQRQFASAATLGPMCIACSGVSCLSWTELDPAAVLLHRCPQQRLQKCQHVNRQVTSCHKERLVWYLLSLRSTAGLACVSQGCQLVCSPKLIWSNAIIVRCNDYQWPGCSCGVVIYKITLQAHIPRGRLAAHLIC